MNRQVQQQIKGFLTQDGAGVNLVRVLGNQTSSVFDPILMLDSFDSQNPEDYTAGFPMHPHRGIAVSYTHLDVYKRQYLLSVQWDSMPRP